jgi:hypothetical protein
MSSAASLREEAPIAVVIWAKKDSGLTMKDYYHIFHLFYPLSPRINFSCLVESLTVFIGN